MKVCEIFASIQGETSLVGIPMTFIRLTGCNLRCIYCDTKYAYTQGEEYSVEEIIKKIKEFKMKNIVITGGEPLLQAEIYELIDEIKEEYSVVLETNGSLSIERINPYVKIILDIKTPGSGMSNKNLLENLKFLKKMDEVKFVITNFDDYKWAKNFIKNHPIRANEILFSPAFDFLNPKKLAEWIVNDALNVRLNIQLHKYLNVR